MTTVTAAAAPAWCDASMLSGRWSAPPRGPRLRVRGGRPSLVPATTPVPPGAAGSRLITLGTSGVLALADDRDHRHAAARHAISACGGLVASALVLAESAHAVGARQGRGALLRFLRGFEEGSVLLDCADTDLPRIRELMTRFSGLGFADAAVVACAERNGGTVLTFDRDELDDVSRELPIDLVP